MLKDKPTAIRRFMALGGVHLKFDRLTYQWSATFIHNHHEVWPHTSYKRYQRISTAQARRLLRLSGTINHSAKIDGYILFSKMKEQYRAYR